MNRRGFIQGLLASVAGSTAMVQLATPAEAQALITNRDVLLRQPEPSQPWPAAMEPGANVYVRGRAGQFVPIGIMTSLEVRHEMIDVTSCYSGTVELLPGAMRGEAAFESMGLYGLDAASDAIRGGR